MKDFSIAQAQRMTAPAPFGLLSSIDAEGKTNLMAISWWTYLSNHPVKIGVCLSDKGYSGGNIKSGGEFALNIVGEALKDTAIKCGTCSGRTVDKAAEFGIELCPAREIKPMVVKESRIVFECRLTDTLSVGDHTFYAADVIGIYGNEEKKQLFAFEGYGKLDTVE